MRRWMCRLIGMVMICAIFSGVLTGCFDRREVDELAYVIAIGLDKGKSNRLRMTLQLAVPKDISGGEGGGGGEEALDIITLECPTIYSGLNMANSVVSRQLNISHAKAIIFSRELAQEGLDFLITALPRGREFRPGIQVVVSRGPAEDMLKAIKPKLEINPAKYYELILSAHTYTGFSADTSFYKFYTWSKSLYVQPVAALASIGRYDNAEEFDASIGTASKKGRDLPLEGDFFAGDVPAVGKRNAEYMGLAVFDGGKMVGELDGEETIFHSMITGEFNRAYITLRDPMDKEKFVILDTRQSRRPRHHVDLSAGKPAIRVKIILEADITVIQSAIKYEDPDKMPVLEQAYEEYIRKGVEMLLDKTAKEFKADICGFGRYVKQKFLTWNEWVNYQWLKRYTDSTFKVEVDLQIRRTGLQVQSSQIADTKNPEGGQRSK